MEDQKSAAPTPLMQLTSGGVVMTQCWTGLTTALLWGYVSAIFLFKEPDLPFRIDVVRWLVLDAVVFLLGYLFAIFALRRKSWSVSRLANYCLFGTVAFASLVIVDTTYALYLNTQAFPEESSEDRFFDENIWIGELYPRLFYPTERNFRLHKPGVSVSGSPYGNFYRKSMQGSPTLVKNVLEKRTTSITINDLGFREDGSIADAEIFALGDSFTFGWGVNESEGWVATLESRIGEQVYNLGIQDASPKQELELLRYVLERQDPRVRMKKLLWMIYEGNDLEDDYSERAGGQLPVDLGRLAAGTLVEVLAVIPGALKGQSIINRFRMGYRMQIASVGLSKEGYWVDGVELANPLLYSERFGFRLFYRPYLDRAAQPASYVQEHPNRPRLEAVFAGIRALADAHGFEVATIIAPTAARLHGHQFRGSSMSSAEPHFVDFLVARARLSGFQTVDLYRLMQPFSDSELLFFRDDDHFNPRGNAVAAQLIQRELGW